MKGHFATPFSLWIFAMWGPFFYYFLHIGGPFCQCRRSFGAFWPKPRKCGRGGMSRAWMEFSDQSKVSYLYRRYEHTTPSPPPPPSHSHSSSLFTDVSSHIMYPTLLAVQLVPASLTSRDISVDSLRSAKLVSILIHLFNRNEQHD